MFLGILLEYWLGHFHEMEIQPREKIIVGVDKQIIESAGEHHNCAMDISIKEYNNCIKENVYKALNLTCAFAPWSYWPDASSMDAQPKVCTNYMEAKTIRNGLKSIKSVHKRQILLCKIKIKKHKFLFLQWNLSQTLCLEQLHIDSSEDKKELRFDNL